MIFSYPIFATVKIAYIYDMIKIWSKRIVTKFSWSSQNKKSRSNHGAWTASTSPSNIWYFNSYKFTNTYINYGHISKRFNKIVNKHLVSWFFSLDKKNHVLSIYVVSHLKETHNTFFISNFLNINIKILEQ